MDDELEKQFKFYLKHQDTFVEQYDGRVIVLKDEKVLGAYGKRIGCRKRDS